MTDTKFWDHLKLKNGDTVKFVPPSPNGDRLGGVTSSEKLQINTNKNEIATIENSGKTATAGQVWTATENGAEWQDSNVSGDYLTTKNPVGTGSFSMNRASDTAIGENSATLGNNCEASGLYSLAQGSNTKATGSYSHAQGCMTNADYIVAHAQGWYTNAIESCSHAQGNSTTASGIDSHAEGLESVASGKVSHVEGWGTIAAGDQQHVSGKYNIQDKTSAIIIGNGSKQINVDGDDLIEEYKRSNAFTLDWNGNAVFAGDVTANGQLLADAKTVNKIQTKVDTLWAVNEGVSYTFSQGTADGTEVAPTGAKKATILDLNGKSLSWNQLVNTDTTSVTLLNNNKYVTMIDKIYTLVTGDGNSIAVTGGTDMVFNITRMFGYNNQPTLTEFITMFPASHYDYNAGEIINKKLTYVQSSGKNKSNTHTPVFNNNGTITTDGSVVNNYYNGTYSYSILGGDSECGANNKIADDLIIGLTYTLSFNSLFYKSSQSAGPMIYINNVQYTDWDDAINNAITSFTPSTFNTTQTFTYTFTAKTNNLYLFVSMADGIATSPASATVNQVQIELGQTATDYCEYESFISAEFPQSFPVLKGAKDMYDTILYDSNNENWTLNLKMKSIDLGDLNWTSHTNSSTGITTMSTSGFQFTNLDGKLYFICSKYTTTATYSEMTSLDKSFYSPMSNYFTLYDSDYTDATEFKNAVKGIMLYYYRYVTSSDITDVMSQLDTIDCSTGSTFNFVGPLVNTDGVQIISATDNNVPITAKVNYLISTTEASV